MFWLHSTFSHHPLRFSNRPDLLVPRTSTAMAQSRSFVSIGPSLWNAPSSVHSSIISIRLRTPSFTFLKTCLFLWGLAHWQHISMAHSTRGALQMLIYNTI